MRNDKMHGHIKIKLIFVYLSLRKYDYNCNNLFKSWIVMNSSHNMSNGVNACSDATSRARGAAGAPGLACASESLATSAGWRANLPNLAELAQTFVSGMVR